MHLYLEEPGRIIFRSGFPNQSTPWQLLGLIKFSYSLRLFLVPYVKLLIEYNQCDKKIETAWVSRKWNNEVGKNVEDDDDGGGRDWPSGQKCNSCKQSADQGSPIQPLGTWRSRCDVRWEITFDCILSMPITISNICYTNSATWDILYCQLVLETDFQDEGSRWIKHLDFATSVFLSEWKLISLPPLVCCPW